MSFHELLPESGCQYPTTVIEDIVNGCSFQSPDGEIHNPSSVAEDPNLSHDKNYLLSLPGLGSDAKLSKAERRRFNEARRRLHKKYFTPAIFDGQSVMALRRKNIGIKPHDQDVNRDGHLVDRRGYPTEEVLLDMGRKEPGGLEPVDQEELKEIKPSLRLRSQYEGVIEIEIVPENSKAKTLGLLKVKPKT